MLEWLKSLLRVRRLLPIEMGGAKFIECLVVWRISGKLRDRIDNEGLSYGDLRVVSHDMQTVRMYLPIILKPEILSRLSMVFPILAGVIHAQCLDNLSVWRDADSVQIMPDVSLRQALDLNESCPLMKMTVLRSESSLLIETNGIAGMNLAIAMTRAMGLKADGISRSRKEEPSLADVVHYILQYDDVASGLRFIEFRVVSCLVRTIDFPADSWHLIADSSDSPLTDDYVMVVPLCSTPVVLINGLPISKAVRLKTMTDEMARCYLPFED